jgi:PKD repeat protein
VLLRRIAALAATGGLSIALAAAPAHALITVPIPDNPPPGPPPIPSLPAAGDTPPPAEAISDPIEPGASCGGWYLQSSYAGIWPAGSTWWEYGCTLDEVQYPWCYDLPGACDAGYTIWGWWTDRFYWDGSQPVFLGENSVFGCEHWWDAPSEQWYAVVTPGCPSQGTGNAAPTASFGSSCSWLSCGFDATGSSDSDGTLVGYSWDFGDGASGAGKTAEHTYAQAGTYTVTLTVTDDRGASASTSKTVAAEPSPQPPPNAAPTAGFAVSCAGLLCDLDGSASADADGTIVQYRWALGDATTAGGKTARHSYAQTGTYTIKLTVTDDDGASDTASKTIAPITGLTAHGYKVKGLEKVDLSWSGSSAGGFDVYRDGQRIATTAGSSYTDHVDRKGSGSYTYKVCQAGGAICSNQATVAF